MVILNDLPETSIERNIPLSGCFYKKQGATLWREVMPSFKISKKSFNDLGEAWINTEIFCWEPYADN